MRSATDQQLLRSHRIGYDSEFVEESLKRIIFEMKVIEIVKAFHFR